MKKSIGFCLVTFVCLLSVNVMGGYYDTQFDTANAVDDWVVVSGSWALDDGAGTYNCFGGGAKISVYQGPLAWDIPPEALSDYTVNATVAASGGDAGVIARYKDPGNFYHLRYHSALGLQLYRWFGGSASKLAEVPVTATVPYTLSLTVNGDQLSGSLYVDDVELASLTFEDASLATGTVGFRAWAGSCSFDEIHITSDEGPIAINPLNNALGVSTTPELRWASAEDLHGNAIAGAEKYYLYLSSGSAGDPNVVFVDEIAVQGNEGSYDQLQIEMDKTYYWMIEQAFADGVGGAYLPGDPNNIVGQLWRFETIKSIPVITQQPQDIFAKEGETAAMSVSVATLSQEFYQWYKVVDGGEDELLEGEVSDTLVFDPVTGEDVGSYYCIVTNNGGEAPPSDTAEVILKVMSAHWTLDQADFVGGQYIDLADGHNATTNAPGVTFIEGMDGTTNGAIVVDANSWANAGTWAPSAQTGRFSVSFWMKWDGITGGHHRPIAKRDIDWPTTAWHILINQNTANIEFESYNYGGGPMGAVSTDSQMWQFVCATFDGATAAMYVDGKQTAIASVGLTDAPDSPLMLGAGKSDGTLAFNGALDDIRIYNYTRSPEEVAQAWFDITGQVVCVNGPDLMYDHNGDCLVNLEDFASFAEHWLECGFHPISGCP